MKCFKFYKIRLNPLEDEVCPLIAFEISGQCNLIQTSDKSLQQVEPGSAARLFNDRKGYYLTFRIAFYHIFNVLYTGILKCFNLQMFSY